MANLNMTRPNPNSLYPIKDYDKLVLLKNFVKASNISAGDYTYFDDRRYGAGAYLAFLTFDSFASGFIGYIKRSQLGLMITNKTKNPAGVDETPSQMEPKQGGL